MVVGLLDIFKGNGYIYTGFWVKTIRQDGKQNLYIIPWLLGCGSYVKKYYAISGNRNKLILINIITQALVWKLTTSIELALIFL